MQDKQQSDKPQTKFHLRALHVLQHELQREEFVCRAFDIVVSLCLNAKPFC